MLRYMTFNLCEPSRVMRSYQASTRYEAILYILMTRNILKDKPLHFISAYRKADGEIVVNVIPTNGPGKISEPEMLQELYETLDEVQAEYHGIEHVRFLIERKKEDYTHKSSHLNAFFKNSFAELFANITLTAIDFPFVEEIPLPVFARALNEAARLTFHENPDLEDKHILLATPLIYVGAQPGTAQYDEVNHPGFQRMSLPSVDKLNYRAGIFLIGIEKDLVDLAVDFNDHFRDCIAQTFGVDDDAFEDLKDAEDLSDEAKQLIGD